MAPNAKTRRAWVKDVAVFAGMAALNLILIYPCGVVIVLSEFPKKGFGVSDAWYWVFATPTMLVNELGWQGLADVLLWFNPLIYGLMWWLLWRMIRLMRSKSPGV